MKDITLDMMAGKIESVEPDGIIKDVSFKLDITMEARIPGQPPVPILNEEVNLQIAGAAYKFGIDKKPASKGFYFGKLRLISLKSKEAQVSVQYVKNFKYFAWCRPAEDKK